MFEWYCEEFIRAFLLIEIRNEVYNVLLLHALLLSSYLSSLDKFGQQSHSSKKRFHHSLHGISLFFRWIAERNGYCSNFRRLKTKLYE